MCANKKKKILMISYYFPPLVDVGSLRALGFSQNLYNFGWEPYVLSVKNPDKSYCLIGNITPPKNVKTFYIRSLFNLSKLTSRADNLLRRFARPFNKDWKRNIIQDLFCIPDIFIGWILPTIIKGLQIIDKHNIDVIYVSCKPFSPAITGVILKKLRNKPLILDFRDPISFPSIMFSNIISRNFTQRVIQKIEKYVLKNTDKLIVTADRIKREYLSIYPFLNGTVHTIYNGYFKNYPIKESNEFEKFTILYTGNFYNDLAPSDLFFQSLQKVITKKLILKNEIQFFYLGHTRRKNNWLQRKAEQYGLQDVMSNLGQVSRKESMRNIYRSSMLLLRIVPPMISTKLYEGLATGIPILATINEGEVANLIRRYSKNSYIVTSNNVDDVVNAIKDAYNKWKIGELKKQQNKEFLQEFNKKALTKQFAQILDDVYQKYLPSLS